MIKTHSIVVPILLTAGLAACGQQAATAKYADAKESVAKAESHDTAAAAAMSEENADAAAEAASAPAPDAATEAKVALIAALPLKRGYYVATDTPCSQASNATVMLLRREGVGGSRDFCEFKKIEKTGANTYRVTEACADLQDAASPETSVTTYTLTGDTAFTSKSEHGWERSARYCAQSTMPPDFRSNDISDVTG